MQIFKKYAKKYLLKAWITSLIGVFLCISFFIPSSAAEVQYITNAKFNSLSDIFTGVSSGDFEFNDVSYPPESLTAPFFQSIVPSPSSSSSELFTLIGDFNIEGIFSNDRYYTIEIPISVKQNELSVSFIDLWFIDNLNNSYKFDVIQRYRPDPLVSMYYVTDVFRLNLSGSQMQEISKIKIQIRGQFWSSKPNVYLQFGLLEGRFISISSMTEYEYNSLYGDNDYNIDTGDTIARVDAIENELFDRADLGSITESVFGSLTWFADLSPGIMAAGMIVDELLNFGGINNTWMLNVVRFALMLGVLALFLAIGPGLMARVGSSRSDSSPGNKKGKGDGS